MESVNAQSFDIDLANLIEKEWIVNISDDCLVVHKLPQHRPRMRLPRYVQLNAELSWAIGFFIAEGNKVWYGIGVSNKEIALIDKFRRIIENAFWIDSREWRAHIKTPERNLASAEERWKSHLKISRVKALHAEKARGDVVEIRLNNTLFSLILNRLVGSSLEKISENKELAISFLDGYEVGDGSIIQRKGFLYSIIITVKDTFMKDFLCETFRNLYGFLPSVRSTKGSYEVQVCGIHNMTNMILDGHFRSSARQWNKLITCYLRKQYTRSHLRYWRSLRDSQLSINEIAQLSNRSHWSVRDALRLDARLGLVKYVCKPTPELHSNYLKFYELSDKGQRLIKILDEAESHDTKSINPWSGGT